jgi:hypothetical protein
MLAFLSGTPVILAFPPSLLLFALNLPCRLAAVSDALLGMVNSDLILPLPLLLLALNLLHRLGAATDALSGMVSTHRLLLLRRLLLPLFFHDHWFLCNFSLCISNE